MLVAFLEISNLVLCRLTIVFISAEQCTIIRRLCTAASALAVYTALHPVTVLGRTCSDVAAASTVQKKEVWGLEKERKVHLFKVINGTVLIKMVKSLGLWMS